MGGVGQQVNVSEQERHKHSYSRKLSPHYGIDLTLIVHVPTTHRAGPVPRTRPLSAPPEKQLGLLAENRTDPNN